MSFQKDKLTIEELLLLREIARNIIKEETINTQMLDYIDSMVYDLHLSMMLPLPDLIRLYNKPSDEVESIIRRQRAKRTKQPTSLHFQDNEQKQLLSNYMSSLIN